MKALLLSILGSGVAVPILAATVRHYWGRRLTRRDTERGRP